MIKQYLINNHIIFKAKKFSVSATNSENLDGGTTEHFFNKLLFDLFAALHAVDPEKQEDTCQQHLT